jgi:hypothetical protein
MPAYQSRRAAAQRAATPPAPAEEADPEVVLPAGSADAADAPAPAPAPAGDLPGRSARRSARRSAQRSAQRSARPSNRRSQELTPEQRAERRRTIRLATTIGGAVAGAIILVAAAVWLLRKDPDLAAAESLVARIEGAVPIIQQAISARQADAARQRAAESLRDLAANLAIAGAATPVNPDAVLSVPLAEQAARLRQRIEAFEPEITRLERAAAVALRASGLLDRFARLRDMPDSDLDALERDLQAFVDNPVEPGGIRDETAAAEHASAVGEARNAILPIDLERQARLKRNTMELVRQTQAEVQTLVQGERFQEAFDLVDRTAATATQADLGSVRGLLTDSHAKAWSSVTTFVEARRADARAPGAAAAVRSAALAAARARLEVVISTWQVPASTAEAQTLLAGLGE